MAHSSKLVRPFEDTDEAAVIGVWHRAGVAAYTGIRKPFTWDQTAAVFRERVRPEAEIWVGAAEDVVVAFIALMGLSIDRLYVDPSFWRQGWGSRLVDVAKEHRPDYLTVETDPKPRPAGYFYEANGFEAVRVNTSEPPASEESVGYEWRP